MPLPDHRLPEAVPRMSFTCEQELSRSLRVRKDPNQALRIVKEHVGPLVCRKATRKTEGQVGLVEHPGSFLLLFWRRPELCAVVNEPLTDECDESFAATATHVP